MTTDSPAVLSFAEFAKSLRYDAMPRSEQRRVKLRLLNLIGAVLSGRATEASRTALKLTEQGTIGGASTFWLSGAKGRMEECALVNGMLSQSTMEDDTSVHTGDIVIPAAIAVAEEQRSSGADLLAAIAAGYEITMRLDLDGARLGHGIGERGFRHSWFAVIGAAASAAALMGLTARQIADAMALALQTSAPGSMVWFGQLGSHRHTSERYLQIGENARAAVHAAALACAGFAGVDRALEGKEGLFDIYTGDPALPADAVADLGKTWHLSAQGVKAYPGSQATPAYPALKLAGQLDHDDIAAVEVKIVPWQNMIRIADTGPFTNEEQALLSVPFAVAAAFVFGRYDVEVIQKGTTDPRVAGLAQRVTLLGNAGPGGWGRYAEVKVTLNDGRVLQADATDMPVSMLNPDDWDTMISRFDQLAAAVPADVRDLIVGEVKGLDARSSCDVLVGLLR